MEFYEIYMEDKLLCINQWREIYLHSALNEANNSSKFDSTKRKYLLSLA